MSKAKSENTKPELKLRKLLWDMGYRIHYKKLPGKPDIAFTRHKKAVFMHGCFWHGRHCKAGKNMPHTNQNYWLPKLKKNKNRDKRRLAELKHSGWNATVVWECSLKNTQPFRSKLQRFCAW